MNKEHVFFDNHKAICERIVGACVLYFTQDDKFNADKLRSLCNPHYDQTELLGDFIEVTTSRVQEYFRTHYADGRFSDFQVSLAMSIYADYCRK